MSDAKKSPAKPVLPWQSLLDLQKQRQAGRPFQTNSKSNPTPRFNFNKRSGSR